jgi:hypothetical protein
VVRIGLNKSSFISMPDFFLSSNLTPLLEISDIWYDKQIC